VHLLRSGLWGATIRFRVPDLQVRDSSAVGGLADGDAAGWTIAGSPQGLWGATIPSPRPDL